VDGERRRDVPFIRGRWKSLTQAIAKASNAEKVRAFLALVLVGVLIALQFRAPGDKTGLVASARTLAIAVVAFYFGLHNQIPTKKPRQPR
jgi:hypothetical protein